MAALEADAKERSERRQLREKEAQAIKELGNKAFKEHNFEKALDFYNQVSVLYFLLMIDLKNCFLEKEKWEGTFLHLNNLVIWDPEFIYILTAMILNFNF